MRHPFLCNKNSDFISNDTMFGGDVQKVMLLTGPNMGGKSTFLRQTCMAVIMAQIGWYVCTLCLYYPLVIVCLFV